MDSFIKINRRMAKLMLVLFALLPIVIASDEILYRLIPDVMIPNTAVVNFGVHAMNLQSAIAGGFYLIALFTFAYYVLKR